MFALEIKILIAEDTEITRSILKKILEKMGFRKISEAATGMQALSLIEESVAQNSPYGLVIADWNMPGLSGIELLKRMNTKPQLSKTAFVLLTSNTEKEHVIEAIKSGVAMYMAKPFTATMLEKKLAEAFEYYSKKK